MKQHYQRTYEKGRPTNGWGRGELITASAQVKPGDVLISVCHQFCAENLVRVLERGFAIGDGFEYEYTDPKTLRRSDGGRMFCHDFMLAGPERDPEHTVLSYTYYRAIDRRPNRRIPKKKLPKWLHYD
jgi:hypothetical protein